MSFTKKATRDDIDEVITAHAERRADRHRIRVRRR